MEQRKSSYENKERDINRDGRDRDRDLNRDTIEKRDRDRDIRDRDSRRNKPQRRSSYSHSRSISRSRSYSSRSRSPYRKRQNFSPSYENRYYRRSRSPRMKFRKKTSRDNSAENTGNVLYISNLPRKIRDDDVKEKFEKYGKVTAINIVREPFSQESRGFGFLTFETVKDAQAALDVMNKSEIDGKIINVEVSKRSKPHKPTPGVYLGPKNDNYRRHYDRRDMYYRRSRSRSRRTSRSKSRSRSHYRDSISYSRSKSRSRSRSPLYRRRYN